MTCPKLKVAILGLWNNLELNIHLWVEKTVNIYVADAFCFGRSGGGLKLQRNMAESLWSTALWDKLHLLPTVLHRMESSRKPGVVLSLSYLLITSCLFE